MPTKNSELPLEERHRRMRMRRPGLFGQREIEAPWLKILVYIMAASVFVIIVFMATAITSDMIKPPPQIYLNGTGLHPNGTRNRTTTNGTMEDRQKDNKAERQREANAFRLMLALNMIIGMSPFERACFNLSQVTRNMSVENNKSTLKIELTFSELDMVDVYLEENKEYFGNQNGSNLQRIFVDRIKSLHENDELAETDAYTFTDSKTDKSEAQVNTSAREICMRFLKANMDKLFRNNEQLPEVPVVNNTDTGNGTNYEREDIDTHVDHNNGIVIGGLSKTQVLVISTCSSVIGTFFIVAFIMRVRNYIRRMRRRDEEAPPSFRSYSVALRHATALEEQKHIVSRQDSAQSGKSPIGRLHSGKRRPNHLYIKFEDIQEVSSQDGSAARYHANGVAHAQEPDFIFSPTRPSVPSSQYNTKKKTHPMDTLAVSTMDTLAMTNGDVTRSAHVKKKKREKTETGVTKPDIHVQQKTKVVNSKHSKQLYSLSIDDSPPESPADDKQNGYFASEPSVQSELNAIGQTYANEVNYANVPSTSNQSTNKTESARANDTIQVHIEAEEAPTGEENLNEKLVKTDKDSKN